MTTEIPVIGTAAAPTPLVFTDAAATKVNELIQEEDNPDHGPPVPRRWIRPGFLAILRGPPSYLSAPQAFCCIAVPKLA